MNKNENIKTFYANYSDKIVEKRFNSPYKLRKYAHMQQYKTILKHIKPGMKVLDAGCGEGVLSFMLLEKGAIVTGCDISKPNIAKCKEYSKKLGENITFLIGDSENLPFENNSFDLVVSSHVLEHLPDFDRGLEEIMRVTKLRAVVAIPTVLNPCSLVQVGGGMFWLKGPKCYLGLCLGKIKMIWALVTFREGVDETYAGQGVPHIFRFQWVMKKKIRKLGYSLIKYEASSLCLPYFEFLLPIIRFMDKYKDKKFFRNFGYGTTYIIEKE